jgi:hypothetical protein
MALGSDATHADRILKGVEALITQDGRQVLSGKNGFSQRLGTHGQRCKARRDGGILASSSESTSSSAKVELSRITWAASVSKLV